MQRLLIFEDQTLAKLHHLVGMEVEAKPLLHFPVAT